jgi:hypothetical protein
MHGLSTSSRRLATDAFAASCGVSLELYVYTDRGSREGDGMVLDGFRYCKMGSAVWTRLYLGLEKLYS